MSTGSTPATFDDALAEAARQRHVKIAPELDLEGAAAAGSDAVEAPDCESADAVGVIVRGRCSLALGGQGASSDPVKRSRPRRVSSGAAR